MWTAANDGERVQHDTERGINVWNRFVFGLIPGLPIEDQL